MLRMLLKNYGCIRKRISALHTHDYFPMPLSVTAKPKLKNEIYYFENNRKKNEFYNY